MIKINAEEFSLAGDKYLGRPYSEMDCQRFVELVMRDCGLKMDLGGSNSWYREVMKHGWVGTPEECKKIFGVIPKGALLFIWAPVDAKTPEKFRNDGIGDMKHIGYKTGRGKGAMNSSSTNGCVCESNFKDKSINGGWNRVGLYEKFDYGKGINWMLEHIGIGQDPGQGSSEGGNNMKAKVIAENGGTVKLRAKPSTNCSTYWDIPVGTEMDVIERGEDWTQCVAIGRTGWMKNEFVQLLDADQGGDGQGDQQAAAGDLVTVQLQMTRTQAETLLDVIDKIAGQIIQAIGGRG